MEILSNRFPGLICICEQCGCLMGNIKPGDIYGENFVYCPLCKYQNILNYNKNYQGIIVKEQNSDTNSK